MSLFENILCGILMAMLLFVAFCAIAMVFGVLWTVSGFALVGAIFAGLLVYDKYSEVRS